MYQRKSKEVYSAAGYPFSLDKDGKGCILCPRYFVPGQAELFRKYPSIQIEEYVAPVGGIIEGTFSRTSGRLCWHTSGYNQDKLLILVGLTSKQSDTYASPPQELRCREIAKSQLVWEDGLKLDAELPDSGCMDLRHTQGNYMTDRDYPVSYYQSRTKQNQ